MGFPSNTWFVDREEHEIVRDVMRMHRIAPLDVKVAVANMKKQIYASKLREATEEEVKLSARKAAAT